MRYASIMGTFEALRDRAEQYRERAVKLHRMAEAESYGRLRNQLIDLARQYQELADSVLQAADD
jgi:hypothetical protein